MSEKVVNTVNDVNSCSLPAVPSVETNSESRHHNVKSQELQAEQFISATKGSQIVYPNQNKGHQTVRESTMSLYNSLNAADHI